MDGIIAIGQSLKLRIIPEGIETEEQLAYLVGRGLAAGQGYWFSRALPAARFEEWLRDRRARAAA